VEGRFPVTSGAQVRDVFALHKAPFESQTSLV